MNKKIIKMSSYFVEFCFDCREEVHPDSYNSNQRVCGCPGKDPVDDGDGQGFWSFSNVPPASWKTVYISKEYHLIDRLKDIWDVM